MMRPALGRVSAPTYDRAGTLPLRLNDVIITSLATFAAAYLAISGRWVPGWFESFVKLSIIAVGPVIFRALAAKYPQSKLWDFVASTWLMPSVIMGHFALEPLLTAVHPVLLDGYLAAADLRLFGAHPSYVLGNLAGPVLTELLLICYYSYFIGPFGLALLLYFKGKREHYEELAMALTFFFAINFVCYALVPAIGPRYYLAGIFEAPLQGVYLTPLLDGLMRTAYFSRDCFPSGHTGVTLTVLIFAWRYQRTFFWMFLPIGTGLILATLVGRFHYGIDLIFALPVVAFVVWASRYVMERMPEREPSAARRAARANRRAIKI